MATISARDFPLTSYMVTDPDIGYIKLRALVHNESGLVYCLQKLPPKFLAKFQALSSQGRATHEQDDWETATSCFLQCKEMLLSAEVEERLGRLVYHSLVAWVDLYLAQVYQAVGNVDTLEKVMDLRKEILDCVMASNCSTYRQVVLVCQTYCCTAQYELGDALVSSKEKSEAIQKFAELMSCSKDTAEAEICSLLCSDHEYLGRFSESLRWIREANQARMKNSSDWNRCKSYFLERKAKLLMRLEEFSEAAEVLKDLTYTSTYYAQHPELARSFRKAHEVLHECYMQMSKKATNPQQVKSFKELAEEQRSLIKNLYELQDEKSSEDAAKALSSLNQNLKGLREEEFSEHEAKELRSLIQILDDLQEAKSFEDSVEVIRSMVLENRDIQEERSSRNLAKELNSLIQNDYDTQEVESDDDFAKELSGLIPDLPDILEKLEYFEDFDKGLSSVYQNAPFEDECDIRIFGLSSLYPVGLATTSPLGSSGLGLTKAPIDKVVDIHLSRLPTPIRILLEKQLRDEEDSRELDNWETAIYWSEQMREVLKMTKRCLVTGTYDWLLSWVDLPLAGLYHFRGRNFGKALEIWKEIQECVVRKSASTDKLGFSSADYQISLAALEYELSFSNTSVQENCDLLPQKWAQQNCTSEGMLEMMRTLSRRGKRDIIQKWARAYCISEEKVEEDLRFWLYFGYYRHRNFERALEWLQNSKLMRLKGEQTNGGCPGRRSPTLDYFCCDYDYSRCEIDLFTKLGRHEEAAAALERLLSTKRCIQEGGVVNDVGSIEHLGDESRGQLLTGSPTATGCILRKHSNSSFSSWGVISLVVDPDPELVQSSVGLEYHLLKLPLPVQLAFRKHGSLGRLYDLEWADWENAIFHYEWSLEILDTIPIKRNDEFKKAYQWLKEWVIAPLADLYEHRKKQYKRAFALRRHMLCSVDCVECADQESMRELINYIQWDAYVALYLCAVSDYPGDSDLKNNLIKGCREMLSLKDDWTVEYAILGYLWRKLMTVYANFEGALDFVRQAKQLLDQRYQDPAEKMADQYLACVFTEAICLWHLQRPDEIKRVKYKYWESTGKSPALLQNIFMKGMDSMVKSPHIVRNYLDFLLREDQTGDSAELDELRQKSRDCEMKKEYPKAIRYREECLRLIQENPKLEGLDNSQDVRLGFKDNVRIAVLYSLKLSEAVLSRRQPTEGFGENENFRHAVEYYKKCLRQLSTGLIFPMLRRDMIASINEGLLSVYFGIWAQYSLCMDSVLDRMFMATRSSDEVNSMQEGQAWEATRMETLLGRMFMATRSSDEVNSMQEQDQAWEAQVQDFFKEMKTFLEWLGRLPIQTIGERLISHFTYSLHTMGRKQYTDGWIEWLEYYKRTYSMLQLYHARTAHDTPILLESSERERLVSVSRWNAFLFGEGERTQVMNYQLEMHRRKSLGPYVPQWGLDANDSHALNYIKESCRALLDRELAVFVQYSAKSFLDFPKESLSESQSRVVVNQYFIYVIVIDQDGCQLFMEDTECLDHDEVITKSPLKQLTPEKRLHDLYKYLAYKQQHPEDKEIRHDKKNERLRKRLTITSDKSMNEYLEFLYGALLGPIAQHLRKKPGHKLVVAPSELLTQVPFAALRNPEDRKYLIESRALAIAPSLRVLQMCSERLQDLQSSSHPYTGRPGSVIALGDPTYNQCDACSAGSSRTDLEATGKELEKIVALFGETAVMKLTKTEATAKQLLEWAAKPSQESFRQAIVHIGAHGVVDDGGNHRNNHLQLACDPSVSTTSANSASTSSSTRGKPDNEQSEDDCSDDDVFDSKVERVTEDDSNCVRSLFYDFHRHMPGFTHTATSDGSSSSWKDAKIKRSGGPSASSHDLTVDDINNLETRWNAELLVLSACQTSAGRTTAEGVLSLARAFIAAGVPCVVASLWKVDDVATLDLMESFYDELWKGRDVASALQCATLNSMRKNGNDAVQYWAPFNVWGVPSLCIPKELQKKKSIGINYGRVAPPGELPPPSDVVHLLKSRAVTNVRIYDSDHDVLAAFKSSGIKVSPMVTNDEVEGIASSQDTANNWVSANIQPFAATIDRISVGDEWLRGRQDGSPLVLAMENLQRSLENAGLSNAIKVTTPHYFDVEGHLPSQGTFRDGKTMAAILQFLENTGSVFSLNVFPFEVFSSDSGNTIVDNGTPYKDVLHAMLDTFISAMHKLGFDLPLVISETGWPSAGDGPGVSVEHARAYNNSLVQLVLGNHGTPLRPDVNIETYIFALFNENGRQPGIERNWGLYYPDQTPVYDVNLST